MDNVTRAELDKAVDRIMEAIRDGNTGIHQRLDPYVDEQIEQGKAIAVLTDRATRDWPARVGAAIGAVIAAAATWFAARNS